MTRAHPYRTPVWIAAAVTAAAAGLAARAAAVATAEPPAAATRPAAAPPADPPPTVNTRPQPMSAAFSAVRYRSIFVKGEQALAGDDPGRRPRDVGPVVPPDPRAVMVFNGVTLAGDRPDAMIEDTSARRVFSVRVGDLVAGGRVLAITFDDIEYQAGGKVLHVAVGQTLEGQPAPAGDTAPPTAGGGPAPADPAGTLGNTVGLSTDDILARMKRRRQQEQGGK